MESAGESADPLRCSSNRKVRCNEMAAVLHIEASPLKERSHTTAVARAFLDAYREANPADEIERIDLWSEPLPPFDAATIEAKFAVLRKKVFSAEQERRWRAVQAVSRRFNAADKYVFSVPMWNFGVPYPLKHYIDVVTLAGENWTWTRGEGYRALLSGKRATLIYSSAGAYEIGETAHADDFQKPYLRRWLRFIGVHDISEINLAPTLAEAQVVAERAREAQLRALALAREFRAADERSPRCHDRIARAQALVDEVREQLDSRHVPEVSVRENPHIGIELRLGIPDAHELIVAIGQ
nr:hypothetical protein [uncultured bacterium]